jgi:hypothetical protein
MTGQNRTKPTRAKQERKNLAEWDRIRPDRIGHDGKT